MILLYAAIVLAHVVFVAPFALFTILLDGLTALTIVVPPILAGLWFVPLFRIGHWSLHWQFLIATVMGLGSLSLLVLMLGTIGVLHRPVWIALIVLMFGVGTIRLHTVLSSPCISDATGTEGRRDSGSLRWLWLLTAPFLSSSLLAASNPPGLIWSEEGYGYDVLEYHLQMPREYFEAGSITYAPHNVYANFPSNVEMLYLAGMIIRGDSIEAGTVANFIHLSFAILLVFAAWTAGSTLSARAGVITALSLGIAGWLPYLSGLAYVENAMLFFGMAALGLWLRAIGNTPPDSARADGEVAKGSSSSAAIAAGLAAGFACGCKYTALPLIAMPISLAWLAVRGPWSSRLKSIVYFSIMSLLTFSPWLIKNVIHTGNPVFPLAHGMFQTYPPGWEPRVAERWQRAHAWAGETAAHDSDNPSHAHTGLSWWPELQRRLEHVWAYVPGDHYQRFGPAIMLLPWLGWWSARRTRTANVMLALVVCQLAIWIFATHLFARFAVVLLLPLAVLTGLGAGARAWGGLQRVMTIMLTLGALWNLAYVLKLQSAESLPQVPASLVAEGQLPGLEYIGLVNRELDPDARILLVGEARAFYLSRSVDYYTVFNVNPFVEFVETAPTPSEIVDWLQHQHYTHVLINWVEVRRLRNTYGFADAITPKLFESLERAGLAPMKKLTHPRIDGPYVSIYSVPR